MGAQGHRSILIVEDEALFAMHLQESLAEIGYDVSAIASSCDEAVRQVLQRRPDVILMDVRIQGSRDGIETAALLRASCDAPVIYLTAHADDATILRAKATGPSGYLVKPVKMRELYSAIEISLHRHEMERARRRPELSGRLAPGGPIWGLAREIDDPLAAVIANADRVRDEIEEIEQALRRGEADPSELAACLKELAQAPAAIAAAAVKIARIVSELKESSRPADEAPREAEAPGRP